ncbi:hypothetical protein SDC9_185397 [bioreactor metagenome]|uniref:DeoR-like transcriptional repressor C-terminal sensor domain-containing protein n=1 Tax=bioreactor metagenome TaxID=1076179 RepID=A0A645HH19_9ZZZZ
MVNLVGGFVNRDNLSVSGDIALQYINSINIDIAIISPSGFSLEEGFSSGNFNESKLKHAVTEKARKVVILLLSDKIGKTLPFTFCDLTSVSTIITDKPLPAEFTVKTEKLGIQVLVTE